MANDEQLLKLELLIAKLLRYGVLFAGALLLIGWCSQLNFTDNPLAQFSTFHRETLLTSITTHVSEGQWGMLTAYAGLIVLILLPLLRVILTAVLFYKQSEFVLAGVATFVCFALVISVLLGIDI